MIKMNALKILGFIMVSMLVLNTGCYYDTILPPVVDQEVSYSNDMQPFFNAKCVACHTAGSGVPLALDEGDSYDNLINGGYINTDDPSASSLYVKITPGQSMEQYATDTERALTLAWIEQGALNN